MTDARKYIEDEFETMSSMAIKGERNPAIYACLKMCFIAGMAAAVGFRGDRADLSEALVPALQAVQARYGGRTIFPIPDPEKATEA